MVTSVNPVVLDILTSHVSIDEHQSTIIVAKTRVALNGGIHTCSYARQIADSLHGSAGVETIARTLVKPVVYA